MLSSRGLAFILLVLMIVLVFNECKGMKKKDSDSHKGGKGGKGTDKDGGGGGGKDKGTEDGGDDGKGKGQGGGGKDKGKGDSGGDGKGKGHGDSGGGKDKGKGDSEDDGGGGGGKGKGKGGSGGGKDKGKGDSGDDGGKGKGQGGSGKDKGKGDSDDGGKGKGQGGSGGGKDKGKGDSDGDGKGKGQGGGGKDKGKGDSDDDGGGGGKGKGQGGSGGGKDKGKGDSDGDGKGKGQGGGGKDKGKGDSDDDGGKGKGQGGGGGKDKGKGDSDDDGGGGGGKGKGQGGSGGGKDKGKGDSDGDGKGKGQGGGGKDKGKGDSDGDGKGQGGSGGGKDKGKGDSDGDGGKGKGQGGSGGGKDKGKGDSDGDGGKGKGQGGSGGGKDKGKGDSDDDGGKGKGQGGGKDKAKGDSDDDDGDGKGQGQGGSGDGKDKGKGDSDDDDGKGKDKDEGKGDSDGEGKGQGGSGGGKDKGKGDSDDDGGKGKGKGQGGGKDKAKGDSDDDDGGKGKGQGGGAGGGKDKAKGDSDDDDGKGKGKGQGGGAGGGKDKGKGDSDGKGKGQGGGGGKDKGKGDSDKDKKKKREKEIKRSKEKLHSYTKSINAKNKTQVQDVVSSSKKILEYDQDTETDKINENLKVLRLLEDIGVKLATQLTPTKGKPATVGAVSGKQVFGVAAINGNGSSGFSFPDMIEDLENVSSFGARVKLPYLLLSTTSQNLSLVFMIYNPSPEMNARTGDQPGPVNIGGQVVLASVFPRPNITNLTDPVVITIQNKMPFSNTTARPICTFLVENSSKSGNFGIWSNEGCEVAHINITHSTCHCYHLTNFAILMQFNGNQLSEDHDFALNIITYIGLSLSIAGCFVTLLIHLFFPKLWKGRGFIHMNLVTALGIANIVFFFETTPDVNSPGCTTVAVIIFYFYLAAFSWMLLEGFHIYRMLVKVFKTGNDSTKSYFIAGWGVPLLIVTVTASVYRDNITSKYFCWLSANNGSLWAFAVPVCLVIFINTVMLLIVLRTSFHHSKQDKHMKRSMARTLCILLPVLGLTWLFGIVTFNKNVLPLQYIFAVLNSLQGFMIFVFYCLYNPEVKREISQRIHIWRTEHDIDKAHVTGSSKNKFSENQFNQLDGKCSLEIQNAWM